MNDSMDYRGPDDEGYFIKRKFWNGNEAAFNYRS